VYRVTNFSLPGQPALAYKELLPDLAQAQRAEALAAMTRSVDFRNALCAADRDDLDEFTTWPIDLVEDRGRTYGVVMPLIPADFFLTAQPQSGPAMDVVFDLSWLCAKDSQAQVQGIDRSGVQDALVRIALLAQLVYAVGRLHKHGAVYGDLSLKNAALAVGPPQVKLLDCDAAAALNDPARVQLHSPFFKPPEIIAGTQQLQDDRTDVYKLGLCIIRGLQQGQGISQAKDPLPLRKVLDAQAVDTVARAVGARSGRPTAKELFACLERNLLARAAPPIVHRATLNRTVQLRGLDVEVRWESTGGEQVRILGANGLEVRLPDPGTTSTRHVVTPRASGEIVVEIGNAHGTVQLVAGTTTLYDLPPMHVDLRSLPRPQVPRVPPITVPSAFSTPPAVPSVTTTTHPVPRPIVPPLTPVTDAVLAIRTASAPIRLVDGAFMVAFVGATGAVRTSPGNGPCHADLGTAVAAATRSARAVLDDAWQDLRDRAARQRSARRQPKGTQ
jgi:hypothetical protein